MGEIEFADDDFRMISNISGELSSLNNNLNNQLGNLPIFEQIETLNGHLDRIADSLETITDYLTKSVNKPSTLIRETKQT